MSEISYPKPVKLIIGILSGIKILLEDIEILLEKRLGKIDLKSEVFPFDYTDYYEKEMGVNILRKFLSFKNLIDPEEISSIKVWTNQLEDEFKQNKYDVIRPINLDPGYLSHCNLILASTKDYYHRIYLQDGIYAEVTLFYQEGKYENLPWTYPDYKTEEYKDFFSKVRTLYAKDINHN
ncbi:MAG: DUF4416 family protein [Candidatus Scalinduaceae bacterium]